MSEKSQSTPSEFQPVENPIEMENLLGEAGKTLASTMIWTKNQKTVLHTHIASLTKKEGMSIWNPPDFDPKSFVVELTVTGEKDCFFSVSLERASIFFKARFRGYSKDVTRFSLPEKMYKVQRRKNLRITIPETDDIRFEFQNPFRLPEVFSVVSPPIAESHVNLIRRIFDLSAGGLSFLVARNEAKYYHFGLELDACSLALNGRLISFGGQVRHVSEVPVKMRIEEIRVGISFLGMRQMDSQCIASHVFETSRRYYSRFI